MCANENKKLLKVESLGKDFEVTSMFASYIKKVLNDITFDVKLGGTFGICGESGSGKTVLLRAISYLDPPSCGRVFFDGENLRDLKGRKLIEIRKNMQMVFQDPYTSLHPRFTAEYNIKEAFVINGSVSKRQIRERVKELLNLVGINLKFMNFTPNQFSGGQRQRISIARALAMNPKLILFDSPTSLLDVSVKAQVLNLIKDLQKKINLTYVITENDLGVLKQISDEIAVMYEGKFIEVASRDLLYSQPRHPYTIALLNAIPTIRKGLLKESLLKYKEIKMNKKEYENSGCEFYDFCPKRAKICKYQKPKMKEIEDSHWVRCHK